MYRVFFIICNSTNESKGIMNIFKFLGSFMSRHQMCIIRGLVFITLPNYISTISALFKINKILKH